MTKIDILTLELIVPDDYQQFWVHNNPNNTKQQWRCDVCLHMIKRIILH